MKILNLNNICQNVELIKLCFALRPTFSQDNLMKIKKLLNLKNFIIWPGGAITAQIQINSHQSCLSWKFSF
jgi:hypothetical protein